MKSWQSRVFEKFLWLSGRKKKFMHEETMHAFIEESRNREQYSLDPNYMKKHGIGQFTSDKMDVYVLNQHAPSNRTIVYFHGGAYINEPLGFHWRYLVKLAKKTGYKIYVPIYPKLPDYTHQHCFEQVDHFYKHTLMKYQNDLIFMGDSSGGGLALAYAQRLAQLGERTPKKLILFSPWLDIDSNYPGFEEVEKIDPMISVLGARILGELWKQPGDARNYLVSPLYGPLQGIGEITLIVGTAELLIFDGRKLKELADSAGVPINYYEFEGMNHVFPVFPIPEAEKVWDIILPILISEKPEVASSITSNLSF